MTLHRSVRDDVADPRSGTARSGPRPAPDQRGTTPTWAQPATAADVDELYRSLLAGRRDARRRLQTMQVIEQAHRHTPLAELVDLAVDGALNTPDLPEPARQP